ncbi:LGFP repeat-containing protein, partial [Blastococcus sp. SYSU D00695]
MYVHPTLGTRVLPADVVAAWQASGAETGPLGHPTGDPVAAAGGTGTVTAFEHGQVFASGGVGAALWGAVLDRYTAGGGPAGTLGRPRTNVTALAGGGAYAHFERGSIYWTPATGARLVTGSFRDRWAASGWESGPLGYPTSEATPVPDGQEMTFQGGALLAADGGPARLLSGPVLDRFVASGGVSGELGLATSDVTALAGGGSFAHFQHGSVYYSPATGARVLTGAVRDRWAALGWENSALGYPTSDVTPLAGG